MGCRSREEKFSAGIVTSAVLAAKDWKTDLAEGRPLLQVIDIALEETEIGKIGSNAPLVFLDQLGWRGKVNRFKLDI